MTSTPLHLLGGLRCVSTAAVIYGITGLVCVLSVEEITKMDDASPLATFASRSLQAAMVKQLGARALYVYVIHVWIEYSAIFLVSQKKNKRQKHQVQSANSV